jgi:hypothetical protein
MNVTTVVPKPEKSQPILIPSEPAIIEDDLLIEEFEELERLETCRDIHPHNLDQYCERSRRIAGAQSIRPAYIGYCMLPEDPLGVCH